MNCNNIKNLLPEYLEGKMSDKTEQAVREHLDSCEDCKQLLACLEKSEALLKDMPSVSSPMNISSRVLGKIKKQQSSIFDIFFGIGHSPYKAGFAVGAALFVLVVLTANIAHIPGKSSNFETYQTASAASPYCSQFNLNK